METPFLDQLIEEHQNHIESVEASSYAGIQETRKQLAELEAIKAIIVTHCCMGEAEQLHKLLQHLSDEDELIHNRTHQQIIDDFKKLV